MKEARIIFPSTMFNAVSIAHSALLKEFGGYSVYNGSGEWRAPSGQPLFEDVIITDVAYEPSDANDAKLFDIAWQFRQDAKQVEVYLRYGNGHVQMVSENSCMDNGHGHYDLEFGGILNAITTLTDPGMSIEDRVFAFEYLQGSTVNKKEAA